MNSTDMIHMNHHAEPLSPYGRYTRLSSGYMHQLLSRLTVTVRRLITT
jgi:hypothetical protein